MSGGDDNDALARPDSCERCGGSYVPKGYCKCGNHRPAALDGKVIGTVDGPCRFVPEPEYQGLLQRAELADAKVERLRDMLRVDGIGRRTLLEGIAAMAAATPGAQPIWNVCADALCWARKIGPEEAPAADEDDLIAARMKALDDASWYLHDKGHPEAATLLSTRTDDTHEILFGRWERGSPIATSSPGTVAPAPVPCTPDDPERFYRMWTMLTEWTEELAEVLGLEDADTDDIYEAVEALIHEHDCYDSECASTARAYDDALHRLAFADDEIKRLRSVLSQIQLWDMLNPPQVERVADLAWLKRLVDDGLRSTEAIPK